MDKGVQFTMRGRQWAAVHAPLADSGVVDSRREVPVGCGDGFDFEPLVGEELGLLSADRGLWVGVHGVRTGHSRRLVCRSIPHGS